MRKNILILGAGQYGRVVWEIVSAMARYNNVKYLDDNNPEAIGKFSDYEKFIGEYECAITAIGDNSLRLEMNEKLMKAGYSVPVLKHPMSYVSPSAVIDWGTIIEPFVTVHNDVIIGKGCILSAGAIVNHSSELKDGVHLDCGSVVAGSQIVPEKTKLMFNEVYNV